MLLLDPDSPALAARAAEIGESAESPAGGVRLAEARLREVAEGRDLSVYRNRILPTWRVIRLDDTMYVSAFDAGWEGHESAVYKVMATPGGPLYRGFRRMVDALIAGGERIVRREGGQPVIEAELKARVRARHPGRSARLTAAQRPTRPGERPRDRTDRLRRRGRGSSRAAGAFGTLGSRRGLPTMLVRNVHA